MFEETRGYTARTGSTYSAVTSRRSSVLGCTPILLVTAALILRAGSRAVRRLT